MMSFKKVRSNHRRSSDLRSLNFGDKLNQFYLASFPKSGNTWIRVLFTNLLSERSEAAFLGDLKSYIPDSHFKDHLTYVKNPKAEFHEQSFQFIKTHDQFGKYYRDKNVIYVVRDGRDVLNSYYHYLNARRDIPLTISDLISGEGESAFGNWSDHVVAWNSNRSKNFITLKYENLKKDPFGEISKLLAAINWIVPEDRVIKAIEDSSLDKLQSLEKERGIVHSDKLKQKGSLFFRKGEVGDWVNSFSDEDVKLFWESHSAGMRMMGYDE